MNAIDVLLMKKSSEYLITLEESKIRVVKDIRKVELFRDLIVKILVFILRQILSQYVLLEKYEIKPYIRVFTTTMRLPCAHKIEKR